MALRHHERPLATWSAHTLEAVTRAFRTRLPPRVTLRRCKTSVSYETSSKSHASKMQDERFVRDFLQKSRVKSPKRAFRTRLPPKVTHQVSKTSISYKTVSYKTSSKSQAETPVGAYTSRSPAKQFRDSSPSKQHPLTRQSQCDSDIHPQLTTSRFLACHESFRVHSQPAQSTPPATKSDNIISCELQQHLHHTTRLACFPPVLSKLPSTKIAISAETCHENRASMQHSETQIPMARPHPTPQKHHSPNANPNGAVQKTVDLTKRCACAVKSSSHISTSYISTRFHAS